VSNPASTRAHWASAVIAVTSAHASVGTLTLAAVILQMQIRRNVRPHRKEEETANPTAS
jgi:hypothetical protein